MPANGEILPLTQGAEVPETEPELEEPRKGTLAWVQAQGLTVLDGVPVPSCHRVPEGASLKPEAGACSVVRADGSRCKAAPIQAFGLCIVHCGGGGFTSSEEARAMGIKAGRVKTRLRLDRQLAGLSARRAVDPRAAVRLRAAQRANDLAEAIVDGPLDADLKPYDRQAAALKALDAAFPLAQVTAELSLDDADSMDWKSMQRLAVSLLG